jgi:hypothetical protein
MTTPLQGPLKRELTVNGEAYTLTITPDRLTLVPKGRRKGYELDWTSLVSGEAALASALRASLLMSPKSTSRGAKAAVKSATETRKSGGTPGNSDCYGLATGIACRCTRRSISSRSSPNCLRVSASMNCTPMIGGSVKFGMNSP